MKLNTYIYLVPKLRINGDAPPLPIIVYDLGTGNTSFYVPFLKTYWSILIRPLY
jgi:hypothetical protein